MVRCYLSVHFSKIFTRFFALIGEPVIVILSLLTLSVVLQSYLHMWQSLVEIKHYSAVYFDHISVFEVL